MIKVCPPPGKGAEKTLAYPADRYSVSEAMMDAFRTELPDSAPGELGSTIIYSHDELA
jgi:hypothetical protein